MSELRVTLGNDDIPRWIRNSDWLFKAGTTINLKNVKHCPNLRNHATYKKYKQKSLSNFPNSYVIENS